jgi:hypothetical protein
VCCPICVESRAHAHTTVQTKARRYKWAPRAILPWAHLLWYHNARGGVTEYVLETKAESVDTLVQRVPDLVAVVQLEGVDFTEELVERLGPQQ